MSTTTYLAGVDIGGTKCAVCLGTSSTAGIEVIGKQRFPTPSSPSVALAQINATLAQLLDDHDAATVAAIGVSCGGPLDSRAGLILSPPNLPGWDRVDVITPLRETFAAPAGLQNDANACALAEWQWGAGRGYHNIVFLTFGTGMGAGLILDGRLYSGTNDLAGEVGHIRLEHEGPVGYGKAGSFEGYCSGGGIARLARSLAEAALNNGHAPSFCQTAAELPTITAERVAQAAHQGDALALNVFEIVGRQLGRGLAVLIDLLNPQRIVIGSIYGRQQALLEPRVRASVVEEALPQALAVCEIVPAGLGERVGDLASLAVARHTLQRSQMRAIENTRPQSEDKDVFYGREDR
jgi:glucokinase